MRGPCSGPKSQIKPGAAGKHLRVQPGVGQVSGDELGGGELLAPELGMGVDVPAPGDQVVVVGVQPAVGSLNECHDATRLAASSSTRSRSAGVSANATTVRASMIAPSKTALSPLGLAAAAANPG